MWLDILHYVRLHIVLSEKYKKKKKKFKNIITVNAQLEKRIEESQFTIVKRWRLGYSLTIIELMSQCNNHIQYSVIQLH